MGLGKLSLKMLLPGALLAVSLHGSAEGINDHDFIEKTLPKVYNEVLIPQTLFCRCPISLPEFEPSTEGCAYRQEVGPVKLNLMHVMPPAIGWSKAMQNDLHNVYPVMAGMLKYRDEHRFAQWKVTPDQNRVCALAVDDVLKRVQPPEHARGVIARTYMYMTQQYRLKIPQDLVRVLVIWNKLYPPDATECERNEIIAKYQGNDNPFLTQQCKLAGN